MNLQSPKKTAITLDTGNAAQADLRTEKNVPITVSATRAVEIGLSAESCLASMELKASAGSVEGNPYEGPYTVTPLGSRQVLQTRNLVATANIVVEPIPSNYGRITWNGSFLTVS